jgi:hypothetical protein
MNKCISIVLFITGLILIGMSGFYVVQIIRLDLWEDVIFRVVSVMAFIGGGVFIGLSRIIKNQDELILLLRKAEKEDGEINGA